MPFLGLLDVSGIQRFLFRSPELKKIAAASAQIESMGTATGLFRQTADAADARCIVTAGGNAAFLAENKNVLQAVFQRISRTLLESGEPLQIIVCIEPYVDGRLPDAYQTALAALERRKLTQRRDVPFHFSGLAPAEARPARPLKTARRARRRGLPEVLNFDDLICGSSEATGLMAVISVDGIGMGRRLGKWLLRWSGVYDQDEKFIAEYSLWSESLKRRWDAAWAYAADAVETAFPAAKQFTLRHAEQYDRSIWLQAKPRRLPCRRIYQGGDDLSFVCDARVTLSFTEILLRRLRDLPAEEGVPGEFRSIPASAGIAFVDAHFPFARAVFLAEQVRVQAKKAAVDHNEGNPPPTLNWWVNRQGAMTIPEPAFPGATLKPYLLDAVPRQGVSWKTFDRDILPGMWRLFGKSRGKLKQALTAAETGDQGVSVGRMLRLYPLRDASEQEIKDPLAFADSFDGASGFDINGYTFLLDAGELYDIHFPFGSPCKQGGTPSGMGDPP